MEGSAAAGPAGVQGQAAGQGDGEGAADQQQNGGLDVSAITQTLESLRGGQEEMRSLLQAAQQQGEPEAEALPELDLSSWDMENPAFDPNQAAQSLTSYIEQQAQARSDALVKEHIEPLKQQQDMLRRSAEARDLVGEFPEMGQEEVARNVLGVAAQIAESVGMPELAQHVPIWRLVYLAGRATDAANQEGDEDPRAAHLEGGGGAGPGGGQQAGMTAADIVGARRGAGALPFQ